MDLKKNSLDYIRYAAAFSVALLHFTHYALQATTQPSILLVGLRKITESVQGVVILFALSGFLITASLERCYSNWNYIVKRASRLVPPYYLQILFNAVLMIVFYSAMLDSSFIKWFIAQFAFLGFTPNCLSTIPSGSINGALWTIAVEIQLYFVLMVCYPWIKKLGYKKWFLLISFLLACNLSMDYILSAIQNSLYAEMISRLCIPYLIWFAIGVLCYLKREEIVPVLSKYFWGGVLLFAISELFQGCIGRFPGYYADIVASILLPLIVIGLGYKLGNHHIRIDITYEIFLYHWIVINILLYFGCFGMLNSVWVLCLYLLSVILISLVAYYLNQGIKTWIGGVLNKERNI